MIYDGFDFSPYLIVNDIRRPILPPQSLTYKTVFGRDGAYFFRKQHEPIVIPVDVTIYEKNVSDYREKIRFLSGKLNKSKPKPLIFSDEPDRYIEGIIQDTTELEEVLTVGQGTLHFFCPDPYYYAIEDEVFTFHSEGSHDFSREKGNTESLPIIEIEGSNSGGIITLKSDDTTINFDGDLFEGEILVFDSKLVTSYIVQTNGVKKSANNDIDTMDFPFLRVGANNIQVITEGNASVNEIRIYCLSRWT